MLLLLVPHLCCMQKWAFFSQMRSRQFDDFPSNWSEAKEIEFVVLGKPDRVEDLKIDITTIDVVCGENGTFLGVVGRASWSEITLSGDVELSYELSVNNIQVTSVSRVFL